MKTDVDLGDLGFVGRSLLAQAAGHCAANMREIAESRWPDVEPMAMAQTFGLLEDRIRRGVPFRLRSATAMAALEIVLAYAVRFAPQLWPARNPKARATLAAGVQQIGGLADRLGLDGRFVRSGAMPLGASSLGA